MKSLLFLVSLCYPVSTLLGFYFAAEIGVVAYFLAPIILFAVLPVVEMCLGKAKKRTQKNSSETWLRGMPWVVVCVLAAAHFFMIIWGALHAGALPPLAYLGLTISVGITTGSIGITTAHELLHKQHAGQRALGLAMMLGVSYMFFY